MVHLTEPLFDALQSLFQSALGLSGFVDHKQQTCVSLKSWTNADVLLQRVQKPQIVLGSWFRRFRQLAGP
jgi:hypothetical protein